MYPIVCFFAGWFLQKTRHKISINKTSASDTPRACVSVCVLKATIIFAVSVEIRKTHSPFHRCIDSLFLINITPDFPWKPIGIFFTERLHVFAIYLFFSNTHLTFSFSTKSTKAVLSISTGWPCLSYSARTKWKKLDFLRLEGGCFS